MGEHAISQRSVTDRIPIKLQLTGKSREGSHKTSTQNPYSVNVYILLDVLLCSITDFYIWQGSLEVNSSVLIGSFLVRIFPFGLFPWKRSEAVYREPANQNLQLKLRKENV